VRTARLQRFSDSKSLRCAGSLVSTWPWTGALSFLSAAVGDDCGVEAPGPGVEDGASERIGESALDLAGSSIRLHPASIPAPSAAVTSTHLAFIVFLSVSISVRLASA